MPTNLALLLSIVVVLGALGIFLVARAWQRRNRAQSQGAQKRAASVFHEDSALRQEVNQLLEESDADLSRLRAPRDITSLNSVRNQLLQKLLTGACALTGASHGRIFRVINAYHKESGLLDKTYGFIVELITAPHSVPSDDDPRYFRINQLSSEILRLFPAEQSQQATSSELNKYLYNSTTGKPSDPFLDPDSRSGILIPLFEGLNVVGLLSLEASDDRFSAENDTLIDACEQIAWMASDMIASAKVRLEDLQSDALLEVYQDIMYLRRPDIDDFMKKMLCAATRLTTRPCEWAQILLIRHYPHDQDEEAQRVEKSYTWQSQGANQRADPKDVDVSQPKGLDFDADYPLVTYPAFRRVIIRQASHLNVDLRGDSEWKGHPSIPWANARSFLCVPLIRPADDLGDKAPRAFGLLSLAISRPCRFNDSDDRVLNDFAQALPLGVRNIELREEARGMVSEVEHGLFKAFMPLYQMVVPNDPATWESERIRRLTDLTRDLMRWFFALANEDAQLDDVDDEQVIDATKIIDRLREPIETLGSVISEKHLIVNIDRSRPLTILSGKRRGRYLRAALFLYLENGFKYDPNDDIEMSVSYEEFEGNPYVRFDVISRGTRIPEAQQPLLFKRGFRANLAQSGDGLGLYQVRRISHLLGGKADYRFEEPNRNIFFIRIPWIRANI